MNRAFEQYLGREAVQDAADHERNDVEEEKIREINDGIYVSLRVPAFINGETGCWMRQLFIRIL